MIMLTLVWHNVGVNMVTGFGIATLSYQTRGIRSNIPNWNRLYGSLDEDEDSWDEDNETDHVQDELAEVLEGGAGIQMDDLNWRVEKLRLEEQNTKRFLKARPAFLPYDECSKWVQAFGRWKTQEDWREWIAMGEKRNSYIPSRPDEYYQRLGAWISWDHFLLGEHTDDNSISEFE